MIMCRPKNLQISYLPFPFSNGDSIPLAIQQSIFVDQPIQRGRNRSNSVASAILLAPVISR
jgi:hypothetical protein